MNAAMNSVFIRTLNRLPVERTPVWMMRQAGRYLPEYRSARSAAGDFLSLCKQPELACEVTLQPLRRFSLDAAILFSDILTIPDAMGLGLSFVEAEGPQFARVVRDRASIQALPKIKVQDDLHYVIDAVRLIRQNLDPGMPLIGFSGSPWTLFCYMVEGRGQHAFKHALCLMYEDPESTHLLLSLLTSIVTDYLQSQIVAGVNAVMIFDTWGGLLSRNNYLSYSLDYMQKITQCLKQNHPEVPVILFTKGGGQWLGPLAQTGCDALSLDWTCDLSHARAQVGDRVALQGNLDPTLLLTSPACIRRGVQEVLAAYGAGSGHVFNLGHGITPDVPIENVHAMITAVHEFSPFYHQT